MGKKPCASLFYARTTAWFKVFFLGCVCSKERSSPIMDLVNLATSVLHYNTGLELRFSPFLYRGNTDSYPSAVTILI